jgi:hypothetical protein
LLLFGGKKMVKSTTSRVFFPGEKSPNFPKFFDRKLVSLDLKGKKKEFSNLKLMMTNYITKLEKKIKKSPSDNTLLYLL